MKVYWTDIEKQVKRNEDFRRVLFTTDHMQLVIMNLRPGEEIGSEVHADHDQFFRIEEGVARIKLENEELELEEDAVLVVPAGVRHNVINPSNHKELKLYTIYSPPAHPDETIHRTKADALRGEPLPV